MYYKGCWYSRDHKFGFGTHTSVVKSSLVTLYDEELPGVYFMNITTVTGCMKVQEKISFGPIHLTTEVCVPKPNL